MLDLTCCDGDSAVVALLDGDHTIELDFLEGGGTARLTLEVSGPGTATLSTGGEPGLLGELFQLRIPVEGVTVTENSIYDNFGLGIDLECGCGPANDEGDIDLGPNGCLNSPEITGATPLGGRDFQLAGSAAASATVEAFATAGDPSGTGEGKIWLASVVADPTGAFTAVVTMPDGYYGVTAEHRHRRQHLGVRAQLRPARP
jgi:hypothetical protein